MPDTAAKPRKYEQVTAQTERRIVGLVVLLGVLYGYFFLPIPVLNHFAKNLTSVVSILATLGLSGLVGATVGFLIASQDILTTGTGEAAQFFRNQYPSKMIRLECGCREEDADFLWFEFFNPWESIDSKYNYYARTFDRGSACRLIYILFWSLVGFFILAVLAWVMSAFFPFENATPEAVYARLLLLFLVVLTDGLLYAVNRPGKEPKGKKAGREPTGCWRLWKEINDINKAWLQKAVFDDPRVQEACPNQKYAKVLQLLAVAQWRKRNGYPPLNDGPEVSGSQLSSPPAQPANRPTSHGAPDDPSSQPTSTGPTGDAARPSQETNRPQVPAESST
jgi:hypothetical protein